VAVHEDDVRVPVQRRFNCRGRCIHPQDFAGTLAKRRYRMLSADGVIIYHQHSCEPIMLRFKCHFIPFFGIMTE
jgi:hypothetical protein